MSVLIFMDHSDGHFKKSSLEAAAYGAAVAQQINTEAIAVVLGTVSDDTAALGTYGVQKVLHADAAGFNSADAAGLSAVLAELATAQKAQVLVVSHNTTGKAIAPRLSAKLKAGLVSGAISLPESTSPFIIKKSVFSGKAFARIQVNSSTCIISLNPNAYSAKAGSGNATVEKIDVAVPESKVKVQAVNKVSGELSLTEAERVVSGGRGLKGPENWALVEDLAKALEAATACSRPVSDAHWRPHHEHVGQTGIAIAPNLYIAIGISGAIQHLAGVNRSKVIVVINKDPEAPFFKAADYGIVGDAFEVVPQFIQEVKKFKGIAS